MLSRHLTGFDVPMNGDEISAVFKVDASSAGCLFAGNFTGAPDFGAGAVATLGATDLYISKYHPNGALLVARTYGDTEFQHTAAAQLGADDSVYVMGLTFNETINLGGDPLSNAYLAKLTP